MAYTTIKQLRADVRKVIRSLDPVGDPMGAPKFRPAGEGFSWEKRPKATFDRCFTIDQVERGTPTMFGVISEIDYAGSFQITIGHVVGNDRYKGADRRDTDIAHICRELENKSNFPSGVSLIRYARGSIRELRGHWLTTITFSIHFALAAA